MIIFPRLRRGVTLQVDQAMNATPLERIVPLSAAQSPTPSATSLGSTTSSWTTGAGEPWPTRPRGTMRS